MPVSRLGRRVLVVLGLGVSLPALLLAVLGVYLTLRISRAVEEESTRYNTYLAQQVAQAFETELMVHLRGSIVTAETAARNGGSPEEVARALAENVDEFLAPQLIPFTQLADFTLLLVDGQPLLFSPGSGPRSGQAFAGLLLRGRTGDVIGAGGWWLDPRKFLGDHLTSVIHERLPSNPRLYGGLESTRRLSVELLGPQGNRLGIVRDPESPETARIAPLEGPFAGFSVRVAATSSAPVVWAGRFVTIEIVFILLMALTIVAATGFGLRYTIRQIELAQLKASFVSNVTHELKTPIALIRLAVETLEMRRITRPEEAEKFLRSIARETTRLSQLVDNILDFARLEAGQRLFRFERVNVADVVNDAIESFRPRFEDQGFQIDVDVPETLPLVRGDARALSHCVLNLLDNAIKYSRARREVRVVAAARDGAVQVAVSDRGIGIATADQSRIFEKFVRVEAGLVHDVKGAGLGLSLVDQIVRAHGGRVELVSSPGEGSTFTLVLPALAEEVPRTETRAQTGS
ncbi:MAG: hypothetical protein A2W00_00580 [Candidatus Eisenbacteria bacterium RBG_16_71_46]|nr:MAG: hypothetical protein A2W00_00580 [Candidatus Eisenbacteria bacterium RBG_16_71_46]OGF25397.1 MAG: hypothetical protein A2V63_09740 [Candidatus Eisenbacteria bacterium RBG_19FT_COMBO_70_11]